MKNVYMMVTDWCPHCKRAKNWMDELKQEHPEFQKVNVEIIDEEKQEELLVSCWVFAHGLSTLIATGFFKDPNDNFIEKALRDAPAKLFYEYIKKYSK